MRTPLLLVLALGCQQYNDLEEACPDGFPGDQNASPEAEQMLKRVQCYRRLTGLPMGRLDVRVQEATQNHVDYLELNQPVGDLLIEQAGIPSYTGYDGEARLKEVGMVLEGDGVTTNALWEVGLGSATGTFGNLADLVDYLADDPYLRQVILQPSWSGSGFGVAELAPAEGILLDFAYWMVTYQFPATQRAGNPVIYPKDGQINVPTSVVVDDLSDSLCAVEVGFPISATFGIDDPNASGDATVANPYGLRVLGAVLNGGARAIPLDIREPGDGERQDSYLTYTVAFFPLAPLDPDTEYTFEAAVETSAGEVQMKSTFTTAPVASSPVFFDPAFCIEYDPSSIGTTPVTGGTGTGTTGSDPLPPTGYGTPSYFGGGRAVRGVDPALLP